jgi:hypothetical protein
MNNRFNTIYDYIEALDSASENDVELFKHFLCEQFQEMELTDSQIEYMRDKADLIEIDSQIFKTFG